MKNEPSISTLKIFIPNKMKKEIGTTLVGLELEQFNAAYNAEKEVETDEYEYEHEYEDRVSLRLVNQIIPTLKTGDTEGHLLFEDNQSYVYKDNGHWFYWNTNEACFDLQREISQHWRPAIKKKIQKLEDIQKLDIPKEELLELREKALDKREAHILKCERKLKARIATLDAERKQVEADQCNVLKRKQKLKERTATLNAERKQVEADQGALAAKTKKLKQKKRRLNKSEEENRNTEGLLNRQRAEISELKQKLQLETFRQEQTTHLTRLQLTQHQQSSLDRLVLEKIEHFQSQNEEPSSIKQSTSPRSPTLTGLSIFKEDASRDSKVSLQPKDPASSSYQNK